MPKVTFLPNDISIEVPSGTELIDTAKKANIEIDSPCGGKGTCGKCLVKVAKGDVDTDSLSLLSPDVVSDGYVLACRTKISNTPVSIEIPKRAGYHGGKFGDNLDDINLIRSELFPKNWKYDPMTIKWKTTVTEPKPEDGLSDLDRLSICIQKQWGKKELTYHFSVLKSLADNLRENNGNITVTLVRTENDFHVIGIEPGDTTAHYYGIAVDVGTTTVAVQLVDLHDAKIIGIRTDYNDQIPCGLDIISRINFAQKPERLEELKNRILHTINRLINQVTEHHGIEELDVCAIAISGNTTMTHLLLGLKPEYIRLSPYIPTVLEVPYLSAAEIGIDIKPGAWVYISPSVGSYVGGDITAGVLCTDLATDSTDLNLFIDIGTNGEIVIGNNEFLVSCACSAGPAFEGGEIEFGMRASVGAIEKVNVDPETGKADYITIGEVKPSGICGSGMISLLANLFLTGWIEPNGKLTHAKKSPYIITDGRRSYYIIAPKEESANDKAITLSDLDIEKIIRAKGAIYSACSLILDSLEMDFNSLSNIFIAGGFGRFLDIDKAIVIGLVPDLPKEKFKYIGNSSLMGTYMVLISQDSKKLQKEIAKKMTYIDLSNTPNYMDHYTNALFLPHTDINKFPSVRKKFKN